MDAINAYIKQIDEPRRKTYQDLLAILKAALPKELELVMQYGMPSFVVPFSYYPKGYHVNPKEPLPFIALGVQKGHIGLYHLGIYGDPILLSWFEEEYKKQVKTKLNMGKSCIRFTNIQTIPFDLIKTLAQKMSVDQWIEIYESHLK